MFQVDKMPRNSSIGVNVSRTYINELVAASTPEVNGRVALALRMEDGDDNLLLQRARYSTSGTTVDILESCKVNGA